jgi:hypothetical protein
LGILTQIVAADEHEVEAIGESLDPKSEWSAVERRDIDIPKIATLISVLTGDLYDDSVVLCEPIYISPAEGAFVLHFSDIARERLAELEEEAIEIVALELAATEEYEYAEWDHAELFDWLIELNELARTAGSEGQSFFVWMHPLRT